MVMDFDLESTDGWEVTWKNFKGKRDHPPKECVEESQKSELSFKK